MEKKALGHRLQLFTFRIIELTLQLVVYSRPEQVVLICLWPQSLYISRPDRPPPKPKPPPHPTADEWLVWVVGATATTAIDRKSRQLNINAETTHSTSNIYTLLTALSSVIIQCCVFGGCFGNSLVRCGCCCCLVITVCPVTSALVERSCSELNCCKENVWGFRSRMLCKRSMIEIYRFDDREQIMWLQ